MWLAHSNIKMKQNAKVNGENYADFLFTKNV